MRRQTEVPCAAGVEAFKNSWELANFCTNSTAATAFPWEKRPEFPMRNFPQGQIKYTQRKLKYLFQIIFQSEPVHWCHCPCPEEAWQPVYVHSWQPTWEVKYPACFQSCNIIRWHKLRLSRNHFLQEKYKHTIWNCIESEMWCKPARSCYLVDDERQIYSSYENIPLKTECGCPSGGGIKNGHIRYPSSYGGTQNFVIFVIFKFTVTIKNRWIFTRQTIFILLSEQIRLAAYIIENLSGLVEWFYC